MKFEDDRNIFERTFIPIFDEVSLFIMGLSFLILFSLDPALKDGVFSLVLDGDPRSVLAGVVYAFGLALSIYHFFTKKEKSDFDKVALLCFAIFTNASAGWIAGSISYDNSTGIMALFPAWNMLTAALLLIFWRFEIINESHISDEDAGNLLELVISVAAVILILFITRSVLNFHWAESYSICVVYATNINYSLYMFATKNTHNQ